MFFISDLFERRFSALCCIMKILHPFPVCSALKMLLDGWIHIGNAALFYRVSLLCAVASLTYI